MDSFRGTRLAVAGAAFNRRGIFIEPSSYMKLQFALFRFLYHVVERRGCPRTPLSLEHVPLFHLDRVDRSAPHMHSSL